MLVDKFGEGSGIRVTRGEESLEVGIRFRRGHDHILRRGRLPQPIRNSGSVCPECRQWLRLRKVHSNKLIFSNQGFL